MAKFEDLVLELVLIHLLLHFFLSRYKNLDKLIHYVNRDGRINVFYSSPSDYVEAKYSYNYSWPVKYDDFFPYADTPHSYWTGYFSSRAASKGYTRSATAYLQAARQLEAFVGRSSKSKESKSCSGFTTGWRQNSQLRILLFSFPLRMQLCGYFYFCWCVLKYCFFFSYRFLY